MDQSAFAAPRRRRYFGTTTFLRFQYTGHLWILGCFGPEFGQKEVRVGAYLSWNRNFGYISSKTWPKSLLSHPKLSKYGHKSAEMWQTLTFYVKFRRNLTKIFAFTAKTMEIWTQKSAEMWQLLSFYAKFHQNFGQIVCEFRRFWTHLSEVSAKSEQFRSTWVLLAW